VIHNIFFDSACVLWVSFLLEIISLKIKREGKPHKLINSVIEEFFARGQMLPFFTLFSQQKSSVGESLFSKKKIMRNFFDKKM